MSSILLPSSLLAQFDSLCRNYWWGGSEARKIYWKSWDSLCLRKADGGLGFQRFREFNLAMLARQLWRIFAFQDLLVSKVLRGKYFPHGDILDVVIPRRASPVWRSLIAVKSVVIQGLRWRIGN